MGKVISLKKYKIEHNKNTKEDDLEEEVNKLLDKYQEKIDINAKNDSKNKIRLH